MAGWCQDCGMLLGTGLEVRCISRQWGLVLCKSWINVFVVGALTRFPRPGSSSAAGAWPVDGMTRKFNWRGKGECLSLVFIDGAHDARTGCCTSVWNRTSSRTSRCRVHFHSLSDGRRACWCKWWNRGHIFFGNIFRDTVCASCRTRSPARESQRRRITMNLCSRGSCTLGTVG